MYSHNNQTKNYNIFIRRGFDYILEIKTYKDDSKTLVTDYSDYVFTFFVEDKSTISRLVYTQPVNVTENSVVLHITAEKTFEIPALMRLGQEGPVTEYTPLDKIKIPHFLFTITAEKTNGEKLMFLYGALICFYGILDTGSAIT